MASNKLRLIFSRPLLDPLQTTELLQSVVHRPRPSTLARPLRHVSHKSQNSSRSFATGAKPVNRSVTSLRSSKPAVNKDRGPASKEETQTDFGAMNVLGNTQAPTSSVDACLSDGFHFGNGMKIDDGSGCLILGGEVFKWRPWSIGADNTTLNQGLLNNKGQWHVEREAWSLLEILQPKPDILILGLGPSISPLSPSTKQFISSLGIRLDIQDTRNAAAQFNMLATERGIGEISAAIVPLGD